MKRELKKKSVKTPRQQVLFTQAHTLSKTIRASTIYGLWIHVLGRPIKDLGDSPDDYNIPNVIAYAAFLNQTAEFQPYGLDLQQSDVVNVSTMGQLGGAIVKNFQDNGWTVSAN
jgi:hypothetical protein